MKQNITLPIAVIIGATVLGIFLYAVQVNKQQSIERQQRVELSAKAKIDCLKIYESEGKKWNNVSGWSYSDLLGCEVAYKDPKTGKHFSNFF
jgi:uncharacterized lipoprotein YehR (DUF1307 family)